MGDAPETKTPRMHRAILVLLWAFASLLNFAKPIHLDDTAGLLIAEAITRAPLRPMGEMLNWLDTAEPIFNTNQPHLFFYLLAGWIQMFGRSEFALHVLISLFSLVAISSFYGLIRRFVPQHALWTSSGFVLGPGFLINQNVMTDIPLLAMIIVAMLLVTRSDTRGVGWGFTVFSAALLTKYTSLFLFPAMVWAAVQRKPNLIWIGLPLLTLAAWSLFNYLDFGAIHILNRPSNPGGLVPSPKLTFALVCNLGIFAVPLTLIMVLRSWSWSGLWLVGFALFFAGQLVGLGHPFELLMLPNGALFASAFVVLVAAGLRILDLLWITKTQGLGRDAGTTARELTLAIWLIGGFGFLATFPPFMASRHALLLAPPLLVLTLRRWQRPPDQLMGLSVVTFWALIGTFVVANDIWFARFYRDMAPMVVQQAQSLVAPGSQIYNRGHWGWQWYTADAGMIYFDSEHSHMQPGDILVDPVGISAQAVAEIEDFEILDTFTQKNSPFTVLDTHRFYASGALALPLFATGPARQIRILRNNR